MDKLFSMRVFSRVAETGSFSGVAKDMDCSVGIVSRAVVSLEDELRTRLLQRTTRRVSLTDSGERYYRKCKTILAEIDAADAEASDATTIPRGRLRVHAVPDLGLTQLMSTIVEYRRAHPQVTVDLKLLPGMPDLVQEQFDVSVLSAASLPDSGHTYRIVGRFQRVLVAAPAYLKRHAVESVGDLPMHALTRINAPFAHPCDWHAELASGWTGNAEAADQIVVNDAEAIRVALVAGAGVSAMPHYFVADDISAGRLVRLFPDYPLRGASVYAVYPSRQHVDAKIRTFVEFLATSLQGKFDVSAGRAARAVTSAPQLVTA
ncbi:LysR family transcriptional regulator (plasmid) [Burkholderia sp. THE68]|uniref:LysR family transcriptional regulator n=1 Tax=Burkholderiaceae TaxID=119060 RepID=UPI001318BEB3|nr:MULTISPECIES: LysR family transcriptional regulator [Burkholderiaceae]BBU32468.1 LysR family transcriptional regulator [Burkholderia sp. THE68]BCQ27054.1 LysR family transcriptional regulator [Caballeronia sp. NK8]